MKKLLIVFIVVLICIGAAPPEFKQTIIPQYKAEAAEKNSVILSSEELKEDNEAFSSILRIPVVSGLLKKNVESKINSVLKTDAIKFKASIEKQAKEAFEYSQKGTEPRFNKYTADTSFEVRYNDKDVLSLTVLYAQYTGGAHGLEVQKGYTFDLKTGKILNLSDLFAVGFDYDEVISDEILGYMKLHQQEYFPEAITSFKKIKSDQPYYIENGNLVIYYGEYEIAPYAAGIPEFRIPFSKLKLAF